MTALPTIEDPQRPRVPLTAADHDLVSRARAVVHATCDGLGVELLARAGRDDSTAKSDGTPVTDADLHADRVLADAIRSAFPDHGIVSEEAATTWDGSEWTWVIDPIDGTSNFTSGVPYWCSAIALLHRGTPVYGCIDAPPLAARFEAEQDRGATRNGEPIRVRPPVDFRSGEHRHVPVIVTAGTIRRSGGHIRLNPRVLGSTALDLAMVASGVAVAAYQRVPRVWDMAAGSLMVWEAGGAYVSLEDPLLPMTPGRDMTGVSCPAMAGADEAWLRDLHGEL